MKSPRPVTGSFRCILFLSFTLYYELHWVVYTTSFLSSSSSSSSSYSSSSFSNQFERRREQQSRWGNALRIITWPAIHTFSLRCKVETTLIITTNPSTRGLRAIALFRFFSSPVCCVDSYVLRDNLIPFLPWLLGHGQLFLWRKFLQRLFENILISRCKRLLLQSKSLWKRLLLHPLIAIWRCGYASCFALVTTHW